MDNKIEINQNVLYRENWFVLYTKNEIEKRITIEKRKDKVLMRSNAMRTAVLEVKKVSLEFFRDKESESKQVNDDFIYLFGRKVAVSFIRMAAKKYALRRSGALANPEPISDTDAQQLIDKILSGNFQLENPSTPVLSSENQSTAEDEEVKMLVKERAELGERISAKNQLWHEYHVLRMFQSNAFEKDEFIPENDQKLIDEFSAMNETEKSDFLEDKLKKFRLIKL